MAPLHSKVLSGEDYKVGECSSFMHLNVVSTLVKDKGDAAPSNPFISAV